MNKYTIIKILEELVQLYSKNELTEDSYREIIQKNLVPLGDDNMVAIQEANFIYILFQNFPYYKILEILNTIKTMVDSWSPKNSPERKDALLIEGCIEELIPTIQSRMNMEVNIHIYKIMEIYCQLDYLDEKDTFDLLKKTLSIPYEIASLEILQKDTQQQRLPDVPSIKKDSREEISELNYRKKVNVENMLTKNTVRYFNDASFEKFLSCFEHILKVKDNDAATLQRLFQQQLKNLNIAAHKAWMRLEEKEEHTGYQYTLLNYFH